MSTDAHRFLGKFSDLTHKALGAAFEVSNEIGIGFLKKSYANTLVFDLSSHGIKVDQQKHLQILCRAKEVGLYVSQLISINNPSVITHVHPCFPFAHDL